MGQSVAVQVAKVAHYANRKRPRITVIDHGAFGKEQTFLARYPYFREVCDIEFVEADAEHPGTLDRVAALAGDPDSLLTVAVTFDDDSKSLSYAIGLGERLAESPVRIMARMADDTGLARALAEHVDGADLTARVAAFGMMAHVCRRDILLAETLDERAKAIHNHFLELETARGRGRHDSAMNDWDNLPDLLKDSNREGAAHIPIKLRAIGCAICDEEAPWPAVESFEDDEVLLMAQMEHARWSAQYRLDGWRPGTPRDDARKIHPSLIPWDDLPEDAREKNYYFVRIIPDVLHRTGQKVCRVPASCYPPIPPP
jgi:hypothetical protein